LSAWVDAITRWLESPQTPEQREAMAKETQAKWSWSRAFDKFWEEGLEE